MIELTPGQAKAVADLAGREGNVVLRQLAHGELSAADDDIYATPHGAHAGFRIARDGTMTEIGETLSASG